MFRPTELDRQARFFHGEFSSADASALTEPNSRFTLYETSGTAITLAPNERVIVTDFTLQLGASGLTVQIYEGADATPGAGEIIFKGTLAANGFANAFFSAPHYLATPATYPKLKTSAIGQVDCNIRGVIVKG